MSGLGANRTPPAPHHLILMLSWSQGLPSGAGHTPSWAGADPLQPNTGEIPNYTNTQKREVVFLWKPQQLMSIPGAVRGQARVVIVPVVMVVVCADQVAVRGLLVVGDQVFVWEPLERQT